MEWCMSDRANDLVVPNDQCVRSNFLSKEKWKQCGLNTFDESDVSLDNSYAFGNSIADDGDFSCETFVDMEQLEMDCLVVDGEQSEVSGAQCGISESSNYWTALLNNQDYQLDGFPWTNQTDENFLNTILVDDFSASDQFHISDSLNSHSAYSTENNLVTDTLLESHEMGSYEQTDAPMLISSAPQNSALVEKESFPREARELTFVNHSMEETVLQEFGSAVQKMTHETRLCFRDAMFRLATNSEKQSSVIEDTSRMMEEDATEQETNTIDRTIADLLFNKPYQNSECHQSLIAKPHNRYPQKQLQLTLEQ